MKRVMSPILILSILLSCGSGVTGDPLPDNPEVPDVKTTYRNPVVNFSLPDPTIIQAADSTFYLYATEDIRNVPILHSSDLVNWTEVGTAFTDQTRPNFEPKGGIWAPDINRIGDKYVLYYSMSVWGGERTCGIGVARSDKPEGPFQDHGMLFRSNEIGVQNSIDPFYIEEGGSRYLFWGSFRGIFAIELTDNGLSVKPGAEKNKLLELPTKGLISIRKMVFIICLPLQEVAAKV